MKSILKSVFVSLCILMLAAPLSAQTIAPDAAGGISNFVRFNPPPCDFNDTFYKENGIDPTQLVLRFGNARQFGLPSLDPNVPNWVADSTCTPNDPTRRNIRILATTGGFRFEDGAPIEFISIIAFITNQNAFLSSFTKQVGGSTISISKGANPRGIHMQDIVSNFEGYAGVKQVQSDGRFALNPCAVDMQATTSANGPVPDAMRLTAATTIASIPIPLSAVTA